MGCRVAWLGGWDQGLSQVCMPRIGFWRWSPSPVYACGRGNRPGPVGGHHRDHQARLRQRVRHLHHQRLCQVRPRPAARPCGPRALLEGGSCPRGQPCSG